ncbi:MAG: GspE/PulE family protein [Planctomycetaceae bacterium]|jgi:general secretion pathway protein E|nr:GspE/PulE family protein [Planctomycetaceae bacterium]
MPLFSKKSASNGQPSAVSGNGERPPEAAALARSGDSAAPVVADQPRDWSRVSELLGDLSPKTEQLQSFPDLPGSDVEPWETLLQMLAVDEHTGLARLAKRTGLAYIEEPRLQDSASRFYETVPASMAREHMVAGVAGDGESVTVATAHPMQPPVFAMLEERIGLPIRIVLSPRSAVTNLINRGYEQKQDLVTEIVEEMPLDQRAIETAAGSIRDSNDLLQLARQTPVIRLVNMILFEALRRRASDIHVHPMETKLVIRFRIDGMLVDAFSPPLALAAAISSRLKVMTELDIANRHSPQDGHTSVRIGSRKVDIRLSVIPNVYGERIVLRLLDQTQTKLSLDQVGMSKEMQRALVTLIDRPNGIILVTGPTGSGKTTSLYGALGNVDRTSRNVMTIEDPVEYHLEGISQTQVNVKRGVTFAAGLRALLRQDPDVILVGEIRDQETAQLAVQASLTGHLVLATLHTNDAPSAISRLLDIGIEPYLVTSTLLAVLAQRLLRRTCQTCHGTGKVAAAANVPAFARAGGGDADRCEKCLGTGYFGRIGVFEIMRVDDSIRRLTVQRADAVQLFEAAKAGGFRAMLDDARDKVAMGLTTEAEIARVLG